MKNKSSKKNKTQRSIAEYLQYIDLKDNHCTIIKTLFRKSRGIDDQKLSRIISQVQNQDDIKTICRNEKISKYTLFRYLGYWMNQNNRNIWAKVPERGKGKNNYNQWDKKMPLVIKALNSSSTLKQICTDAKISYQTLIAYLYHLLFLAKERFFETTPAIDTPPLSGGVAPAQ